MISYPKIESLYKRDMRTHKFIEGMFKLPEYEYLKGNIWQFTEKIDGMGVRVLWQKNVAPDSFPRLIFRGRTNKAQMPTFLFEKLQKLFTSQALESLFSDTPVCLYGEGYGARIQGGGSRYLPDSVNFVLFDICIGDSSIEPFKTDWWLKREDIEDIAKKLGITCVPIVGEGTLMEAVSRIRRGLKSQWGDFLAEGMVLRPKVELLARNKRRIITKIKHSDFSI